MFGSDYRALVLHYLNNGLAEGRLGYKVGANHGYGRWTVRSDILESYHQGLFIDAVIIMYLSLPTIRSAPSIGPHHIYVSGSGRTGGAIDSLVWRDKVQTLRLDIM